MRFISLLIGKILIILLRLSGRSASALPGLLIEKTNPTFLQSMLGDLPQGVIIITGTNGKTTTTKVTTALLEATGLRVLTNDTGSNFVRGTIAAVIDKATLGGALPYDIAVFEQDEAHAVHFVEQVKPRGVAILNIMRDQMDRFGEIDTTAKLLQMVAASSTGWVLLNANDERVSKLVVQDTVQKIWYGHSKQLQHKFLTDDELHHGVNTTYIRAATMDAELTGFDQQHTTIKLHDKTINFTSPLAGSHNAINLAAALAIVTAVVPSAQTEALAEVIKTIQPAFGRGEVLRLSNGATVTLQLVKNPSGFTHALGMLDLEPYDLAAIAINDDYADGRDVSWLWDVDFSRLVGSKTQVLCGGVRGYDMAVRLKYDRVTARGVYPLLSELVDATCTALQPQDRAIVYCTYTAMLKIRLIMKKYSEDIHGALI